MASPTSSSGYGVYAPQAQEPFNVENTLSNIIGTSNPSEAENLLDLYQIQRQTAEGNYNVNLQGQHDFARQQLAQQLYEANLKGAAEAKDPTVLGIMADSPQFRSGVLGGISPDALGDLVSRSRYGQDVTNLEHMGQGLNQASQGGYQFKDPNSIPGVGNVGGGVTNLGPALVQAATIRAAAQRATAGSGGYTISSVTPMTSQGDQANISKSKVPPDQIQAELDRRQALNDSIRAKRAGTTTGLPPNGTAPPPTGAAPPPTGSQRMDTNSGQNPVAQRNAVVWLNGVKKSADSGNPEAKKVYSDVTSNMQGPVITINERNGKKVIQGKQGEYPFSG